MNRRVRWMYVLLASVSIGISGCESIALMPRPDVDLRDGDRGDLDRRSSSRRDIEPSRDPRGDIQDRNRGVARDENEVVGTVERVDSVNREIHVRTTETGQIVVIKYEPGLMAQSRDRDMSVDSLRRGDLILVQVSRTPRGERYADLIRINDRQDMGSRAY
jgi:hypothetical protein